MTQSVAARSIFSTLIKAPQVKSLIGGKAFGKLLLGVLARSQASKLSHNIGIREMLHRSWRKMSLTLRFKFNCFSKANRLAVRREIFFSYAPTRRLL